MSSLRTTTTCTGCGNEIPESLLDDALCVACRYASTKKAGEHLDGDGSPVPTEFEIAADAHAFNQYNQDTSEIEAEIHTDETPDNGESAQLPPLGLDASMVFDLIIPGAKDSKERDLRLLTLAMKYNHSAAPKSKTELALWLDVPRSSVDRLSERVSQHLQGEIARFKKSPL